MKLSVVVNTYNHQKYVEQALESVLSQRTSFPFEIVVVDDCSTDNTQCVLRDYARRHPGRFRLVLHEVNRGDDLGMPELLGHGTGEMLAFLEGDDFWSDRSKLQTQVQFLEENPEYVLCGHNCTMLNEWTGTETLRPDGARDRTLSTRDLLGFHMPTASLVMRNLIPQSWPEQFKAVPCVDRQLAILLSMKGPVHYRSHPMSVYRMHPGGIWSGTFTENPDQPIPDTSRDGWKQLLRYWQVMGEFLQPDHQDQIANLIARAEQQIALKEEQCS